ncbi:hypothetical protein GQ457_01G003630 [Hibiscus cannabinus]
MSIVAWNARGLGDVNIVADQSEKEGGAPVNNNQAKWFLDFMDISGLIELPIKGGTFTWTNMRSNDQAIAEKLDKVLISKEWSLKFPKAIGMIKAAVASDHNPIIVFLEGLKKRRKKDFKFESRWLLEEDCHEHVRGAWSENFTDTGNSLLNKKMRKTRVNLKKWSKKKYGKNRQTIEGIKQQLLHLQKLPLTTQSKMETLKLKSELQKLWESEERHWHQRARVNWINYGDKNTKFFHATTIQRHRHNAVLKIKDESGRWIEEEKEIRREFQRFFERLYTKEEEIDMNSLADLIPQSISADINSRLGRQVTEEEIKKAAFEMGALKSPGPDGFSGIFFQTFWETVKSDVVSTVLDFFETGNLDEDMNKTNIVLIPKVKNPNALVFEVESEHPIDVWNRASAAFEEFNSMSFSDSMQSNSSSSSHSFPSEGAWSAPPLGFLKVNCDAAFDPHSGRASTACVVRDGTGEIVKGSSISFLSGSASIAEAIAVRHGVLLAINEGWERVIFESDNKGVISRINSIMPNAWDDLSYTKVNPPMVAPQFGQLTSLAHLNMSWSIFSGKIPLEISHLSKLSSLDLSFNGGLMFEGHVFENVVGNLTQLRHLLLSDVDMSSVEPTSFLNMSSYITTLVLTSNGLQGNILVQLAVLNLEMLDLSYNNLGGPIPASLANLTHLDLSHNNSNKFLNFDKS